MPGAPRPDVRTRRSVLAAAGTGMFVLSGCLGGDGDGNGGGIESQPLPDRGDPSLLSDVRSFPSEGTQHVERGTDVDYDTYPPTSGPHYAGTVAAGFYEETPPMGDMVHTLEHGAVVIYYDPAVLTEDARASLRAWANAHTGTWRSVVVVPHARDDPEAPYVLTAWRHLLRMNEYDAQVVRAFLAEYLGRGPEHPVR
ncbi:MAG: DUF3105 domain-containing protein [Haloferacaceae archaeon]